MLVVVLRHQLRAAAPQGEAREFGQAVQGPSAKRLGGAFGLLYAWRNDEQPYEATAVRFAVEHEVLDPLAEPAAVKDQSVRVLGQIRPVLSMNFGMNQIHILVIQMPGMSV
ncbi:hypothetical protein ACFW5W_33255 [Streptomyces sp. NPDC058783]|uniref:hypothetical protein n=1 Tax=unclassified Streptomyces TaxID=2593676 RepID=UPI0026F28F5E|nr:hypothetical protein [Streptomyces sp. HUAS CX7]WKX23641.1 hypothetical protein Q3Y68_36750 [Streptomyces sp. HUAS CX7]